ncbi:hypothetical protein Tsp_08457, partial [Trichinella spiralis]|uniref:hypothetical protein n=1 Tax=Trichinella spiralis TaxID=6334 RepID=UPI0001EFB787
FKEWCKEKVPNGTGRSKSQTAQSGTREDKSSHDQRYMRAQPVCYYFNEKILRLVPFIHGEACFDLVDFFNMAVKEKVKTGRHEADRGRHEADRGPHEAEQEKTKFLGPQFCRSGIGILRRAKLSHSCN